MAAESPMLMGSKREKEDPFRRPRRLTSRRSAQNLIDRGNKNTIVTDGLASEEELRLARPPDGVSP